MKTVTFASKLNDDDSLTIPGEAVAELGIHPGDEVQVRVEATRGTGHTEDPDQDALQAKFERFFDRLDILSIEKPTTSPKGDPAEEAFAEAMDEKYRKLGFQP